MTPRCPRCGCEARYHRAGEPVALCGWPLGPCATRMAGEFERATAEATAGWAERKNMTREERWRKRVA